MEDLPLIVFQLQIVRWGVGVDQYDIALNATLDLLVAEGDNHGLVASLPRASQHG